MTLFLLLVLCSAAGPVQEEIRPYDRIKLKNGQVLKGNLKEAADQDSSEVRLELVDAKGNAGGVIGLSPQNIEKIIRRRSAEAIYRDELLSRDLFDPEDVFYLAEWAAREDVGLKQRAAGLAHLALRLDPAGEDVYLLLDSIISKQQLETLSSSEKDRIAEVVLKARKRGMFLPHAYYKGACILIDKSRRAGSPVERVAAELLEEVRKRESSELRSQAVEKLARMYLRWEKLEEFVSISPQLPEPARASLQSQLIDKLLLRGRKEDYEKAERMISGLPEGPARKLRKAALAWRRGDAERTETLLLEAAELTSSPEIAFALGVIEALRGKRGTAREIMKIVPERGEDVLLLKCVLNRPGALEEFISSGPDVPGMLLFASEKKCEKGEVEAARDLVQKVSEKSGLEPSVRGLLWPLRAKIEYLAGDVEGALRNLYYADMRFQSEGRIPLAVSNLLVRKGRFAEAAGYLEKAKTRGVPESSIMLAEAYAAYSKGDLSAAGRLAESCAQMGGLPEDSERYLELLRRSVWEATSLESWQDDFIRNDSSEAGGLWYEREKYGVKIELSGNRVVFSGTRKGEPDNVTFLFTHVNWERFYRAEFRLRAVSGDMVFGVQIGDGARAVRLETEKGGGFALVRGGSSGTRRRSETLPLNWKTGEWHRVCIVAPESGRLVCKVDGESAEAKRRVRIPTRDKVKIGVFLRPLRDASSSRLEVDSARFWRFAEAGDKRRERGY